MERLTKTRVDALRPTGKRYSVTDPSLPGFEIRVGISGTKTAAILYRRGGKLRRLTLGKICESYPFAKAREDAIAALREAKAGRDPAADKREAREAPTLADLAERFMGEHAAEYCSPRTIDGYRDLLRLHILPALGSMKVHEITREDLERMHRTIGETRPGAANRALTLCSSMFSQAEHWGIRELRSNPCYKLRRYRERKMERFLSPQERARLEAVLVAAEKAIKGAAEYLAPGNVIAVRLLAMTGCRKSEIVGLRWRDVDLEHAELRLPETKTGLSIRPLTPQAVALLRVLRAHAPAGQALVCVSETGDRLHGVGRAWLAIRRRAQLEDVRLHDLRHSAASDALAAGVPLAMVGVMLGHKSPATTARYAHLADEHRKRAAVMMGEAIERNTREGADALLARAADDYRAEVTGALSADDRRMLDEIKAGVLGPTKTVH